MTGRGISGFEELFKKDQSFLAVFRRVAVCIQRDIPPVVSINGLEAFCAPALNRSYSGVTCYEDHSDNGSVFAWRHDDLCPLCTSVLFALPPESADGVDLDCLPYAAVPERRQSIFTPVLESAAAPRAPPSYC